MGSFDGRVTRLALACVSLSASADRIRHPSEILSPRTSIVEVRLLLVVVSWQMGLHHEGAVVVKQGYRLIIVDKDGVLVSEFQLTERALAQPEAFVEGIKATIDGIEEEES